MKNVIIAGLIGLTFVPVPRSEPGRDGLAFAFAVFLCLCIVLGILDGMRRK